MWSFKNHYGDIRPRWFVIGAAAFIALLVVLIDMNFARICDRYSDITGTATQYVRFDVCYVQQADGEWLRYAEHELRQNAQNGLQR